MSGFDWPESAPRFRDEADIQAFLDEIPYSTDPIYRCPSRVLRDRRAHCVDGALLACAGLRTLGHPPLLMELRAVRDDDHFLAIFRRNGAIGAIAKSNFAGLRWREPVYRSLRELVMSYFEDYYNVEAERTLRAYSLPIDLRRFDALRWWERDEAVEPIVEAVDCRRHIAVLSEPMVASLHPVDRRSYLSGMVGVDEQGLYRP